MIVRDVDPRQEVLVEGEWHRVTTVLLTEREDGTAGAWLYFRDRKPWRANADDPIEVRL